MKSLKSILAKAIVTVSLIAGFTNAHAHSEAFKPEFVDTLVSPYLTIQEALAADKLTDARGGAQIFLTALKKGPSESDAPGIEELATSSGAIVASKNIADARSGFLALSKEMQPLIEHVGTTNKTDLFVVHCPMAFDGQGANWIQDDKTVANPYYGARMLRCGDVQKQIAEGTGQIEGNAKNAQSSTKAELIPASAALIAAQGPAYPDMCVVSDEPLVEGEILDFSYRGELVRFCCKGCRKDFMEDPEGFMNKLQAMKTASSQKARSESGHNHESHRH